MKSARLFGMVAMGGVLALSLAGCGGSVPGPLGMLMRAGHQESILDDSEDEDLGVAKAAKEKLDDQVSVDEDQWYCDGATVHHVIVFTNKSSKPMQVSSNSEALNKNGEVLGIGKGSTGGVGPNCKGVLIERINGVKKTSSLNTKLSATVDTYSEPVTDLKTEASINNKRAIVKITNNGEKTAEKLDVNVLFFKDGKLMGYDADDYSMDDLEPGDTTSDEFTPFYQDGDYDSDDYDSVEAIVVGSSEGE